MVLFSFDPPAARALIGTPLIELTDRVVPLADLAPHAVAPLLQWLADPPAAHSGADEGNPRLSRAARRLERGKSVRDTARAVGLGERQLERVFENELGLRPKTYGRIHRMRRAVELGNVQDLVFGGLVSGRHDDPWSRGSSERG